jgi:hypothetical protein
MCIGGGGGGGNGGTIDNVSSGPGQPGAITRVLFNAQQLPDRLYVQVGAGGAGSTVYNTANSGGRSIVALQPAVVAQNLVAISGNTAASQTPETVATQANMTFATLGNFISTAYTSLGNVDITPLTSTIVTQGTQGGFKLASPSSVQPPKNMLATSISPFISGGISSTTTDGTRGNDGYTSWKPFFSLGGTGGGSSSIGAGGAGGNGGIGSGGGSGGSGQTVGGVGGKGGDGLVVIISF